MKVGVYLDDFVPHDGGAYTFQTEIASALDRLANESHHEFVLFSQADPQTQNLGWIDCPSPGLVEKLNMFLVRNLPSLRSRWNWQSSLERRARRAGIEFLWFLSPRAKEVDLPYMTIVLDLQHRLQPWFPEVSAYGQWEIRERHYATFLRRASAIIAGTNAGKEEIAHFYQIPESRIRILPHPTPSYPLVHSGSNDKDVLSKFGLNPGYVFYPAQFWAHKNHANLLLAIKQLKEEGVKIPLVLTGSDFGNKAYVESLIKMLDLRDQVHLIGFADAKDLPELYRNALVLAYVSFFGPENLPPLEAFTLGCPVIAADVSGAREQLGDAAIFVDPADPAAIAKAIRTVQGGKVRDQIVARGHERAAERTADNFIRGAFQMLDSFEPIRRTWA